MASSIDFLIYALELLRETDNVTYKKMTGEYIFYKDNVIFGGVYDNRFLVKKVDSIRQYNFKEVIPYPASKGMLLVDIEDPDEIKEIVELVVSSLKCK